MKKKLSIVTLIRMEKVIELARMSWKVSRDLVGEDAEETKEHYITLKTMEYMFEVVTGVDYQTYRSLGRRGFL